MTHRVSTCAASALAHDVHAILIFALRPSMLHCQTQPIHCI
jgi:hypothetical protein